MSVNGVDKTYSKFFYKWEKCRAVVEGEDSVKAKRELYLPRPSGMDEDDYNAYLQRAQFFNATGRTVDGLCGMLGRKEAIINVPDGFEKYLENVDGKGHSFKQYIQSCSRDYIITGWGGVLVDMPKTDNVISQYDFEESNFSATMIFYKAESIKKINWRNIGSKQYLNYVILEESVEVPTSEYETELREYRRVCDIDEEGFYRQTLYNERGGILEQVNPTDKKGNKFKFIPFWLLSNTDSPENSKIDDLVNVNLSHFRKSADYENGLHWTGVPTPWSQGADVDVKIINGEEVAEPLKLGGSVVLNLPAGGSMHYLEFSGSGCSQLAQGMNADEDRMAILGARIISQERKGVESAETAEIHRAGENSILASIAINLSYVFTNILKFYLQWSSGAEVAEDEVKVKINTDYNIAKMSPSQLTALVSLWQAGGIAQSDLFDNLKEGEIISVDRKLDDMNAEIQESQLARMNTMQNIGNIEE